MRRMWNELTSPSSRRQDASRNSYRWLVFASAGLLVIACGGNDGQPPALISASGDADGDGIPNGEEGTVDANGNGIPAYLDSTETTVNFPAGGGISNTGAAGAANSGTTGTTTTDAGTTDFDSGTTGTTGSTTSTSTTTGTEDGSIATTDDAGTPDAAAQHTDAGPVDNGETGRLVGITEAHNVVRRAVDPQNPLPDLVWNADAAAYAQNWADTLAQTCAIGHSPKPRPYGENVAWQAPANSSTPQGVVNGWASEVDCWTYGTIDYPPLYNGTEQCDMACATAHHSDGCGHYTQVVWRNTTSVGCGVATCTNGQSADIWVCSYAPAGNIAMQYPY